MGPRRGPHPPRHGSERLLDRLLPGQVVSGTVLLGLIGSVLLATMAVGAGGILVTDPLITGGPLSWIRYGHGRDLATAGLYVGVALMVWAWVRLGRKVMAGVAEGRDVLAAGAVWMAPMLFSPPLFTRDVYSYLAQGALALRGLDPYQVGPAELPPGPVADNVHYLWQTTPAPYGPLFILIAKIMSWLTDEDAILGVIGMRLVLLSGLAMLIYALPRLADHLGGNRDVTLWLVVANPMTVVHLVGGPHNDLLMIGLLAMGTLLVLQRQHVGGIALVTVAMAVKASAGVALPFLVWIWARRLPGGPKQQLLRAGAAALGVFGAVFAGVTLLAGVGLGWIPALDAPSLIVNWMSLPTGAGQLAHALTAPFHDVSSRLFIKIFRLLGSGLFLVILARQWWLARSGESEAVRRAAIALLWAALLAPATLPWYLTWALVLGAALMWRPRALAAVVAASTWLVLCTYPTGESGLNSVPYQIGTLAVSVLAAVSLLRKDPLRLHRKSPADEPAEPTPDPVRAA
jgi:alpha-1,6-mannosyltransferase